TCLMDRLREAEAELATIPDSPELRQAESSKRYRPPPREKAPIEREIERLMGLYRSDVQETDLATRSPIELFAWCLSRHGATYEEAAAEIAKAAKDLLLRLDKLADDPTQADI